MRMHKTLALAQELEWDEVERYHAEQRAQLARLEGSRRGGDGEGDGNRVGVEVDSLQVSIPKPCEEAADNARITDEALKWSLGWQDTSMLGYLRQELPLAIQQEHVRKYEHYKSCTTVAEAKKPLEKIVFFQTNSSQAIKWSSVSTRILLNVDGNQGIGSQGEQRKHLRQASGGAIR